MKTILSAFAVLMLGGYFHHANGEVVTQELVVRYHKTTSLSNSRADAILADATNILQKNDGPGDVACDVKLKRKGDVIEFRTGNGRIRNENDFDEIMAVAGDIKLVRKIKWCNRYVLAYGCARPNKSLAVVPVASDMAGALWAHEYGHVKGRNHCNNDKGCDVDCDIDNALMHQCLDADNKRINPAECNAFRK